MRSHMVRVNAKYIYDPVLLDRMDSKLTVQIKAGEIVTVVNLPGCPKANTGGQCHIQYQGELAGMVCTNSLKPIR